MRPRMGFALVRIPQHAGVRTDSANSSLCAVPPIVRFAAPAQLTDWIGSEEAHRPTCGWNQLRVLSVPSIG